jgi:hypothetical protein
MWGLLVAMEQREHFAIVRHAEVCGTCALKIYTAIEKIGAASRYWNQSLNCGFCGNNFPILRLRFEVKDRVHKLIAVCEPCYLRHGRNLIVYGPNILAFIEKEWLTLKGINKRTPFPNGLAVKVMAHTPRYFGKTGCTISFRCLANPWFGYDVKFDDGSHHFFHERDLQPLASQSHQPKVA